MWSGCLRGRGCAPLQVVPAGRGWLVAALIALRVFVCECCQIRSPLRSPPANLTLSTLLPGPVGGSSGHPRREGQERHHNKQEDSRQSCMGGNCTARSGQERTAGALHGRPLVGRPQGRGPRYQPRAGRGRCAAQGRADEFEGGAVPLGGNGEVLVRAMQAQALPAAVQALPANGARGAYTQAPQRWQSRPAAPLVVGRVRPATRMPLPLELPVAGWLTARPSSGPVRQLIDARCCMASCGCVAECVCVLKFPPGLSSPANSPSLRWA